MRGAFESEGDIRSVDLLSSLVALWRDRAGGALRFSRPGATAGFDLSAGEVTATLSSQSQFDTAAILIRAAKLDPASVERLTIPEGSDAALAAMQAGLITAREWRWGQKIRAIEVLSDLLGWLEGEYVFEPGNPAPAGDWALPVPRLVLELFLRSRDRTIVEHYLGPSDLPLLRAENFDEEFDTFGLTADAGTVVRLIDGEASAEEIAERSPAEEFAVLKLLAALTTLGLVHPAEAAPAAPLRRSAPPRREPEPEPLPPAELPAPVEEKSVSPESEPEAPVEAPPETGPAGEEEALPEIEPGVEERVEAEAAGEEPEEREEELEPEPPPSQKPDEDEFPAEPTAPAAPPRVPEREPAPEPERRTAGETRIPPEASVPPSGGKEVFDPASGLPGGGESPPDRPKSGSGLVLGVLLAALVIAVTTLVIVRTRGAASPEATTAAAIPASPRENPVFPPVETAVPLPGHGKVAGRSSPVGTVPATLAPAAAPTASPAAAQPSTRVPTRVQPTAVPTRVPTRVEPTKPPTSVPTRVVPTISPTRVPTRIEPTKTPTRVPTPIEATKAPTRVPVRVEPTKAPTRVPTPIEATKAPTRVPTRIEPTKVPARVPTRPVPTKPPARLPTRPEPTPPPAPARVPSPAAVSAPGEELARADWIRRAERDRRALSRGRDVRYSIQLELACELQTLQSALNWDRPTGTIRLLTTSYRGRTCFRVLWGRYGSLAEARAAKSRVPEFFTAPGNHPVVVSVR